MKLYHNSNAKQPYDVRAYDVNEITLDILKSYTPVAHSVRSAPKCKKYLDVCASFDIETYTVEKRDECNEVTYAQAYMYIWQFGYNDIVIMGRSWVQFVELLEKIKRAWTLSNSLRIIVWVANLSYETQFMRKWLNITEQFSKEKRQPLYLVHDNCIEFHDALPISGGSLKKLAEMYTNTQKCVGDLDYTIPRNYRTQLTDTELSYCYNDVIILTEFARLMFDQYIAPKHFVPLTKTQILLKGVKETAIDTYGKKKFGNMVRLSFPSRPQYDILMNWLFRGGYVHGNMMYTNHVFDIENGDEIESYDFTSSYPSVCAKCYVPHTFHNEPNIDVDHVLHLMTFRCVVIYVTFRGIKNKTWHSVESTHKCIKLENPLIDNGRVLQADTMSVIIDELTYQTYTEFYSWESMEIHWCIWAQRIPLPDYIVTNMLRDYTAKQYNKAHGLPYDIEKAIVNSYYGACVKRFSLGRVTYVDDEWADEDDPEQFEKQVKSACVLPQWGIYITSHARRRLMQTITALGTVDGGTPNDALYCDTDSIKVLHASKYKEIFDEYNRRETEANRELCARYNLDFELYHDLGCFEKEYATGCLKLKYLGAKRYVRDYIKKGKRVTEVTCAGIPKGKVNEYAEEIGADVYDIFKDDLELELCGKMCSHYNDDESSDYITDTQGNTCLMYEKSNVALTETSFHLTLDRAWKNTIIDFWKENQRKEFRL